MWKIRELVVLAIFPFITVDIYEKYIRTLWKSIRLDFSENFRHGLLLQVTTFLLTFERKNDAYHGFIFNCDLF